MNIPHSSNPTGQVCPKNKRKYTYHISGLTCPLDEPPTSQLMKQVADASAHMEYNSYKECPDCGIDFRFHSINEKERIYQLSSLYFETDAHHNTSDACSFYWEEITDDV